MRNIIQITHCRNKYLSMCVHHVISCILYLDCIILVYATLFIFIIPSLPVMEHVHYWSFIRHLALGLWVLTKS